MRRSKSSVTRASTTKRTSTRTARLTDAVERRTRRASGVERLESLTHLHQRAREEARDVHLADADLLGDLGLRLVLEESQFHDRALAVRELGQHRVEHDPVFGDVEAAVFG